MGSLEIVQYLMTVHRMDPKTVTKVWKNTASIFNKSVIEMTLK